MIRQTLIQIAIIYVKTRETLTVEKHVLKFISGSYYIQCLSIELKSLQFSGAFVHKRRKISVLTNYLIFSIIRICA